MLDGRDAAGATPASFISYGIAKRVSKNGSNFGKGEIEGVVAPETGARRRHRGVAPDAFAWRAGFTDGRGIARRPPDLGPAARTDAVRRTEGIRLGLIASMYLGNLVGLIVVLTCVPVFAAILRVPFSIIAPLILVLCAIGASSVHSSTFDVILMLVFGVIGYLLRSAIIPRPAGAGHRAR